MLSIFQMKVRAIFISFIIILISHFTFSQNFQEQFSQHCQSKDTLAQRQLLEKWEKEKPNDAEMFTSYFNYYFLKARQEKIVLEGMPKKEETDSINQPIGHFRGEIVFDENIVNKSFKKIDEGIKKYPNRLDMYFGKIYALGQMKKWDEFTSEIVKTIDISSKINNEWTWTNSAPVEDSANFFLLGIQDYIIQLFDTGDDSLSENMRRISERILKYHPNHIESLSNISITYLLEGKFDEALESLFKAKKLNPKDTVVLGNIAHAYWLKKDKENSIKYYEKVLEYGDEKTKEFAKQRIEELSK